MRFCLPIPEDLDLANQTNAGLMRSYWVKNRALRRSSSATVRLCRGGVSRTLNRYYGSCRKHAGDRRQRCLSMPLLRRTPGTETGYARFDHESTGMTASRSDSIRIFRLLLPGTLMNIWVLLKAVQTEKGMSGIRAGGFAEELKKEACNAQISADMPSAVIC